MYKQFIAIEIWGMLAKSHAVCKFSQLFHVIHFGLQRNNE
jgi:hypothetical protein